MVMEHATIYKGMDFQEMLIMFGIRMQHIKSSQPLTLESMRSTTANTMNSYQMTDECNISWRSDITTFAKKLYPVESMFCVQVIGRILESALIFLRRWQGDYVFIKVFEYNIFAILLRKLCFDLRAMIMTFNIWFYYNKLTNFVYKPRSVIVILVSSGEHWE